MRFQCPRGTRDFYPDAMAVRNWIADAWRRVSLRSGFEEYDGPIFETLDLYRVKSGDAIVSELFHFADRGGREFAIRPEMTPTLARMVAARAASLPRPVKWFCTPRLCRAERPQRGRLREFFQWNIDILGEGGLIADAECIFVAADFFREVGLTADHVAIKINSRELVRCLLNSAGIDPGRHDEIYAVLDKRDKLKTKDFEQFVADLGLAKTQTDTLITLGEAKGQGGLEQVGQLLADDAQGLHETKRMVELFSLLNNMGVGDICRFDMGVVRGLAYYTGIVFEAFGLRGLQRAICGGGRYDQLLAAVGGPSMPATGFATSDVVIQDLLEELNLIPALASAIDVFVVDADKACFDHVLAITAQLRVRNITAAFSYKRQPIGKQLKQAAAKGARRVVIVDAATRENRLVGIKDMETGSQQQVTIESLLEDPFQPIAV